MLDEGRWSDFWTDYCAALNGKFVPADRAPYIIGVALLPPERRFAKGRSISIVADGSNDRSAEDAREGFIAFLNGQLLNAVQSAQNYCGDLHISPDDTIYFLVFNAKAAAPSPALQQMMLREGGRLGFFGEADFQGALTHHPPLFQRYGVTQADEVKRLRDQVDALRHSKQQLSEHLDIYKNEYKVFGDRAVRQRAVEAWKSMIGETQHKLGTIITTIMSNADRTADLMAQAGVAKELIDRVLTIHDLGTDGSRLLNRLELRGLSARPTFTTIEVRQLAKDLQTLCTELEIPAGRVKIDQSVRETDTHVALDLDRWKDVLRELVINSQYWMSTKETSKHRIAVLMRMHSIDAESADLQIEYTDDGPGIPDRLKHDIFLPTITSRSEGMGLGLAVIQKFFDDHSGEIREVGEMGLGAKFVMRLPIRPPE